MQGYLIQLVQFSFVAYTLLIFVRIVSSWFSVWQAHQIVRFVAFCTDPYLNIFRRILPPLGGILDLSPILALLCLRVLEMIVIRLILFI